MKKILIFLVALCAVSCENYTTKHLGGTMTINVEPGYKVTSATFKGMKFGILQNQWTALILHHRRSL